MNTLLILSCFVAAISAHPEYGLLIPNGQSVPDPCGGGTWLPVGHYNAEHHTKDKNPFGLAFAAAGHKWTVALCNADSDGDGKSNGEELGDPNCTWSYGSTPDLAAIGHPGICNPVGSCPSDPYSCGCHGHACVGK